MDVEVWDLWVGLFALGVWTAFRFWNLGAPLYSHGDDAYDPHLGGDGWYFGAESGVFHGF